MKLTIELYEKSLKFAKHILGEKKLRHIDADEVVHSAIIIDGFSEKTYQKIISGIIWDEKYSTKNVNFESGRISNKESINHAECKICTTVLPLDYFVSGFNKRRNNFNYRKICKFCYYKSPERKAQNKKYRAVNNEKERSRHSKYRMTHEDMGRKERMSRYATKQKKELGDWYVKRLLTRHKKIEVTQEMIEEKRKQVLKMRQEGNWRTKKSNP